MEDQGERSPQTFLVDNAAAWTLENKKGNEHY